METAVMMVDLQKGKKDISIRKLFSTLTGSLEFRPSKGKYRGVFFTHPAVNAPVFLFCIMITITKHHSRRRRHRCRTVYYYYNSRCSRNGKD